MLLCFPIALDWGIFPIPLESSAELRILCFTAYPHLPSPGWDPSPPNDFFHFSINFSQSQNFNVTWLLPPAFPVFSRTLREGHFSSNEQRALFGGERTIASLFFMSASILIISFSSFLLSTYCHSFPWFTCFVRKCFLAFLYRICIRILSYDLFPQSVLASRLVHLFLEMQSFFPLKKSLVRSPHPFPPLLFSSHLHPPPRSPTPSHPPHFLIFEYTSFPL